MAFVVRVAGESFAVHGVTVADARVANRRRTCTFSACVDHGDRHWRSGIASVYAQRAAFERQLLREHCLEVQEHKCVLDSTDAPGLVVWTLTLTFTAVRPRD
jgi:hypothetical protein